MTVPIEETYERVVASPGVVFLMGGIDSGKTTFALELIRRANSTGISTALVDADIAQSTVGPPTTIGLKLCTGLQEISLDALGVADSMEFVGSLTPRGSMLPMALGAKKLVDRAKDAGCALIVVDTTGLIAGISGQLLKYSKLDAVSPDFVVAFERGGELEPLVGIAQRFTPAEVLELDVGNEVFARSAEDRLLLREQRFAAYFAQGTSRWRVKPTVFMPTLPPEFDLIRLDGLVVGMEDGKGSCVGIGVLEYDPAEDILRMVSPVTEGVRGLRLGSVRIDTEGRSKGPVSLRQLFGTE